MADSVFRMQPRRYIPLHTLFAQRGFVTLPTEGGVYVLSRTRLATTWEVILCHFSGKDIQSDSASAGVFGTDSGISMRNSWHLVSSEPARPCFPRLLYWILSREFSLSNSLGQKSPTEAECLCLSPSPPPNPHVDLLMSNVMV